MVYFGDEDFGDEEGWKGYEVTVSCSAQNWHFNKTDYAQWPETIDVHIARLVAKHKATGCTQEPKVFDALAEGHAARERREEEANSL